MGLSSVKSMTGQMVLWEHMSSRVDTSSERKCGWIVMLSLVLRSQASQASRTGKGFGFSLVMELFTLKRVASTYELLWS